MPSHFPHTRQPEPRSTRRERRLGFARKSRKSGFSLVEVMVAVVVTGIVLVGAFSSVTQQVRTVERARDYTRVAQILQSEIEYLRTQAWNDLQTIVTSDFQAVTLSTEFTNLYGDRYKAYRWVKSKATDQLELVIKVEWTDGNGVVTEKRTSTLYTKGGMNDYYYRSF